MIQRRSTRCRSIKASIRSLVHSSSQSWTTSTQLTKLTSSDAEGQDLGPAPSALRPSSNVILSLRNALIYQNCGTDPSTSKCSPIQREAPKGGHRSDVNNVR